MILLIHCVLILRFLGVGNNIFLIVIFHELLHLDLVPDTRWRLWGLHVHCIRVLLLMYIKLATSWSSTTRVRSDASNPILAVICCTYVINRSICLFYVLTRIFSPNIYTPTTPSLTFMAISTAFFAYHSSSSILSRKFIAFKRALSVYRC